MRGITITHQRFFFKLLTGALPLLLMLPLVSNAQTGEIKGKVTEKGGKEGVPFASVAAFQDGVQIIANTTDIDGKYTLKPLTPGKYDVKITFVGYSQAEVSGVVVTVDKISYANAEMSKGVTLGPVDVISYQVPLIDA